MDFRTTTNRETYIERFRGHRLAIKVKLKTFSTIWILPAFTPYRQRLSEDGKT